jgi:hypothetical protein
VVDEDELCALVLPHRAQLLALAGAEVRRLLEPARFCVNVPTTSKPSVFASWRSSSSEASNSRSLTLGSCTAATMARFRFGSASCVMVHGAYQAEARTARSISPRLLR